MSLFTLDDASLRRRLARALHMPDTEVNRLVAGYRLDFPAASPSDIFFLATSGQWRVTAIGQAERKAAQTAAPAYMYLFAWRTPILNGRLGAGHCLDVPIVFHDVYNKINGNTGSSPSRYPLQDQMSGAWVAFARNGNPNHSGLPAWPPYDLKTRPTALAGLPALF